jgi:hypothetical protein
MQEQNFKNHTRMVTGYHYVLFGLLALVLIGSLVNLWRSIGDHQRLYSASLIVVLTWCCLTMAWYCRVFALKAQDRAIRAEENLRHFALTGKLLDSRLGLMQVVALRFAQDAEFPELAKKAAESGMAPVDIKRAILRWKADFDRA